ncbi:MAG: biotin--[acetyl-CoA-carboxylase] ligase [Chloroflexota bacterium]
MFQSLGSTNNEALAWASEGAADLSLVVADEQTAGRGRSGRKWLTPPGTALALSAILRGDAAANDPSSRLAGLGALAVADACATLGLQPTIKWPNDVLLGGRKVAGVLVEAQWSGDSLQASVIGMGVNVLSRSTPPAGNVRFPATSIEHALGHGLNRTDMLRAVVSALIAWRPKIDTQEFLRAWESRLAFRGQKVTLTHDGQPPLTGDLLGLEDDGSLRMMGREGVLRVQMGEVHVHPADDRME